MLLYDRVFLSPSWREVFRRRWALYVGLAATWAVILVMLPRGSEHTAVFAVPQNAAMMRKLGAHFQNYRTIDYTLAQFGVITHYLKLCFWPQPLLVDYGFYTPQTTWEIAPYALVNGGLLAATLASLRYQPWLGFLGVWFFAILAPSSSVVPLFQQVAAEKRMYLPLAAVVTAVAVGSCLVGRRLIDRGVVSLRMGRIAGGCLAATVCILWGMLTLERNAAYSDEVSIWEDAVAKMPGNARAWFGLGTAMEHRGQTEKAITQYRKAVELKPRYLQAHHNLGIALSKLNRCNEAIVYLQTALKLEPGFAGRTVVWDTRCVN